MKATIRCPVCDNRFVSTVPYPIGDTACPGCGHWIGIVVEQDGQTLVYTDRRLCPVVSRLRDMSARLNAGEIPPIEATLEVEDLVDVHFSEEVYAFVTSAHKWGSQECVTMIKDILAQW